jgi:outer membrane protein assembly factor BamB
MSLISRQKNGPAIATVTQRGVGYLDGRIFRGTAYGRVIALDAETGELLWQTQAANPAIVCKDKVLDVSTML